MPIRIHPERSYHFLKVRNELFEPWRWSRLRDVESEPSIVIVNEAAPKSVMLQSMPSAEDLYGTTSRWQDGLYEVSVVNRGEPITFHSSDVSDKFPYTIAKDDFATLSARVAGINIERGTLWGVHGLFFNVDHLDLTPRVLSDHIHSDNDRLHGIIAFSCDWPDTRTVELWVDGTTKLVKFQNIGSGEHVLEYSIPGPVVKGWSRAATRMVQLELRTNYKGYDKIIWSGATLAVKTAVPQG